MATAFDPCVTKYYAVRRWLCLALSLMIIILICAQLSSDLSWRSRLRWFQLSQALQHPGFRDWSQQQRHQRPLNLFPISISCAGKHNRTRIRSLFRTETEMLLAARDHAAATNNTFGTNTSRIAFLFLVRGPLPHESLWRRFFRSYEDFYSVYVHATPGFEFPSKSFFHCREIPSKPVSRFAFNMVDAMRRLLAHALLDSMAWNQWFVFVCESSIPVRSFRYVYDYLMVSDVSFVQAFKPPPSYYCWDTQPEFPRKNLRKGELWMAMMRRHAAMVVAESKLYRKFKQKCKRSLRMCTPDEEYIQTLLAIEDPTGIANKTVMYVDWSGGNVVIGSPFSHSKKHISSRLIGKIQNHTGSSRVVLNCNWQSAFYNLSATNQSCGDIVQMRRPSFLFARKFPKDCAAPLFKLPPHVLGF